jgi:small subunit ribosomal protein S4
MFYIKKQRHKPLYKQFIRLRKNVQCRRILQTDKNNILNQKKYHKTFKRKFKKQKWKLFIKNFEKLLKYPKKSYRMYDYNLYHISRFNNYFKRKFANKLIVKKNLGLFYGNLTVKYLKKQIYNALIKTAYSRKSFGNFNFFLIKILESRLDTVLYRSFFTLSMRSARQFIKHGHILVNKNIIRTSSFILKKGDLIEVNPKYHTLIKKNISFLHIWPIPPTYLLINFRTFQILFYGNIEDSNLAIQFPFWIDINTVIKYYH